MGKFEFEKYIPEGVPNKIMFSDSPSRIFSYDNNNEHYLQVFSYYSNGLVTLLEANIQTGERAIKSNKEFTVSENGITF